jgi:hypothetical protein
VAISASGEQLKLSLKCPVCETAFARRVDLGYLTVTRSGDERRRQPRVPVCCAIHLRVGEASEEVETVDISAHGLQMIARSGPLAIGQTVEILAGDSTFVGEVRHCIEYGHRYRIGVHCDFSEPHGEDFQAASKYAC